jgi:hypothetical protein
MVKTRKQTILIIGALLILVIALGVSAVFAQVENQASAQANSRLATDSESQSANQPALQDDGQAQDDPEDEASAEADDNTDCLPGMHMDGLGEFRGRGGMRGHGFGFHHDGLMPMDDVVAESLGVTVEQLQEAHTQVMEALIEENNGDFRGPHGFAGSEEFNTLLAETLSEISGKEITVEAIEAAHDAAREAMLEQLPEGFGPTEEQLALMEARQALKDAIDRDAILQATAEALGLDPTAVLEAQAERHGLFTLLDEQGISMDSFLAAHQEAYANAIQNAVPEFITQDQADLLLESDAGAPGFGGMHGGPHGPAGPGGHHGRGGFGGFEEFAPSSDEAETTGTSL